MEQAVVLIVDDEEGIRETLTGILEDEGYRTVTAGSGEEALETLGKENPDLVFLDVWLPGMDGLETLEGIRAVSEPAVVMISGHGTIETAVKATRMGAYDFLEKPLSLERVVLAAERALERRRLVDENRALRESLARTWRMVGESPAIRAVLGLIQRASGSGSRVLITGESGTGKEIAAHLLHELGDRASKPFIEVNCAAIPAELIESELFGHEKGSFTGAFEQKKGKFEMADGGTLFLDEVGDMSLPTQAKLLRVLETQRFERVGGSRSISVDVRVIAATNKDLEALAREGRFREDLYFRLNVIPIAIPPLRERREDIPLLVEHFLEQLAGEYGQARKRMTPEALRRLASHDWPGNIRELRNLVERVVIMTPSDSITEDAIGLAPAGEEDRDGDAGETASLRGAREAFEKEFITRKLREHLWNISRTAESLQVERSSLHRKIKSLGIELP